MLIAFDLDDTLLDHRHAQRTALLSLVNEAPSSLVHEAPPAPDDALLERWETLSETHLARYLRREVGFQEQRRDRVRSFLGVHLDDRSVDAIFSRYLARYEAEWRALPDVLPVIERLAERHPLMVITNGERRQQRRKMRALGLEACFADVITPEDAGAAKPAPAIFATAAARAGMPCRRCVYVGDDLETDALGARTAGWTGIWLARKAGDQAAADHPVPRIVSLAELPDLIAAL
jgi:putative hydrolase of the HAD superfamily